jgi:hypothetical protein
MTKNGVNKSSKKTQNFTDVNGFFYVYILPVINLAFYILTIVINILAATGNINNVTTGEVSDEYVSLFTPDGWMFSIWGLIYTMLGIIIVVHLVKNFMSIKYPHLYEKNMSERVSLFLSINMISNVTWIICWQYSKNSNYDLLLLCCLIMTLILLPSLCVIYIRLNINYASRITKSAKYYRQLYSNYQLSSNGYIDLKELEIEETSSYNSVFDDENNLKKRNTSNKIKENEKTQKKTNSKNKKKSSREKNNKKDKDKNEEQNNELRMNMYEYWFVQGTFSIYLAWICVATCANIAALISNLSVYGNGSFLGVTFIYWNVIVQFMIKILTILFLHFSRDWIFATVIVISIVSIFTKHQSITPIHNASIIAIIVILTKMLIVLIIHIIIPYIHYSNGILQMFKTFKFRIVRYFSCDNDKNP